SRAAPPARRAPLDRTWSRTRCGEGARRARAGVHRALGGDDDCAPLGAGGGMVTAADVWAALDEVPGPEIPVISVVELGVVREVAVEENAVRIEFTPTFLGCPALEYMRTAMENAVRTIGGEPDVQVVTGDAWSTDRITQAGDRKSVV